MNNLFQRSIFLVFLFIFFLLILNVFILPILHNVSLLNSFFIMYIFWILMIIILFCISKKFKKSNIVNSEEKLNIRN